MIRDVFAADIFLRFAQERDTMLAYLRAEKTAAGDDSGMIGIELECLRRFGVRLGAVRRTPPEELWRLVRGRGDLAFRSMMLAELLLQDAEFGDKAGDIRRATGSRLQAFCLMAEWVYVISDEEGARYRSKLRQLATELTSISDDSYLQGKIAEYSAKL